MMFKLFSKNIEVPTPVQVQVQVPEVKKIVVPEQKIIPPKPKQKQVGFTTLLNDRCEGVVLKSIEVPKYVTTPTIHIVSVCRVNGKKVTPYLKWINDDYCNYIVSLTVNSYNKQYFNLEWMEQNGQTK